MGSKSYKSIFFIGLCSILYACSSSNSLASLTLPKMSSFSSHDEQIIELIQNRYASDPSLENTPINIQASKGKVSISGYVKTIKQSDLAESLAMNTPGVLKVENFIIVRK